MLNAYGYQVKSTLRKETVNNKYVNTFLHFCIDHKWRKLDTLGHLHLVHLTHSNSLRVVQPVYVNKSSDSPTVVGHLAKMKP